MLRNRQLEPDNRQKRPQPPSQRVDHGEGKMRGLCGSLRLFTQRFREFHLIGQVFGGHFKFLEASFAFLMPAREVQEKWPHLARRPSFLNAAPTKNLEEESAPNRKATFYWPLCRSIPSPHPLYKLEANRSEHGLARRQQGRAAPRQTPARVDGISRFAVSVHQQ